MPKSMVIVVLFLIFQLNIAEQVADGGENSESEGSNDKYIVVALDDWDLSDNDELRNLLLNLQSLGESRSTPNDQESDDSGNYENVIIVLDDLDADDKFVSSRNITGRREEVRGVIWNPRKRRERRRKHQAAFGQLTSLEYCWEKHDNCDSLNYNEFKYGLQNKEEQRYWHCNCDLEFYYCLHRLNSTLSNHIGELYFNYNTLCYRQDHEVDKCREYDRLNGPNSEEKRCVQYVLNLNTEQRNQWFDLPFYSGKPMKGPLYKIKTR